jgi:hypothetical protein
MLLLNNPSETPTYVTKFEVFVKYLVQVPTLCIFTYFDQ